MHHRRAADDKQDEELNTNSDGERSEKEEKILLPAPTKPSGWLKSTKRVQRNPWWWVNYRTIMWRRQDEKRWRRQQEVDGGNGKKRGRRREEEEEGGGKEGEVRRRDGGKEKGRQKEVVEQPQRLRRNMVGPPIRYLLESEGTSHGPVTANQDRARVFKKCKKAQKRSNAGGGASADTAMIDRQTGHMVTERKKTRLPASSKASDWWRCKKFGCRNPRWRLDHRTMRRRQEEERWRRQECDGDRWRKRRWEEEKGERTRREEGEGKETWMEVEQPQRPRRKMVGPPIRYLLESEETSHVSVIQSDQSKARVFKQDVRTQKKKKAGGGASDPTAMIDTKWTDRQPGQTDTYRQTHQVSNDLQSRQVTFISPCCVRLQRLSLIG